MRRNKTDEIGIQRRRTVANDRSQIAMLDELGFQLPLLDK